MLPLIFRESAAEKIADLARDDGDITVWSGTWAECAVAISRLRQEGILSEESEQDTRAVLEGLAAGWAQINPEDDLRLLASLVSKVHPLRTADALQFCGHPALVRGRYRVRRFRVLGQSATKGRAKRKLRHAT